MSSNYYAKRLAGERLRLVYDIAPPRVRRYLEAEIDFVLARMNRGDAVLELGCGYGRVLARLAEKAGRAIGIDTAGESLALGRRLAPPGSDCEFLAMDALETGFRDGEFDLTACVQNGIAAFGVDRERLLGEALRVTRPGGLALFSTYDERFWPERLAWFEAQSRAGLLGPIDHDRTGGGVIVCADGFRAGMLKPEELRALCARVGVEPEIIEVDGSSVFCVIERRAGEGGA
jgi:2-polyprenyl-6-hydroxyphenyl methylase/3-demethylubiquinone-9 3-methyltransferase